MCVSVACGGTRGVIYLFEGAVIWRSLGPRRGPLLRPWHRPRRSLCGLPCVHMVACSTASGASRVTSDGVCQRACATFGRSADREYNPEQNLTSSHRNPNNTPSPPTEMSNLMQKLYCAQESNIAGAVLRGPVLCQCLPRKEVGCPREMTRVTIKVTRTHPTLPNGSWHPGQISARP